ncbi:DotI/IcmL/TraM family protein [Undibacterium sp. Ji42W]|uniref:DotI/IcmL/TraM family protein n=1 Tax=Undibacterium sp. Ji42W TaxID=3413039 RepID=UPI003BF2E2FB
MSGSIAQQQLPAKAETKPPVHATDTPHAGGNTRETTGQPELNMARAEFYLDRYRFIQKIVAGLLVLTILLAYALYDVYRNPPKPLYIAAENDGRIIELRPISRPTISKNALLTWAAESVTSIFTYDYVNYRKQFQGNVDYFSAEGWQAYMEQLDKSGTLQTVKEKSMLVSAVVTSSPVITGEAPVNGVYMWKVEMPIDVTYTPFGQSPIKQKLIIKMNLRAISPLENPRGVVIDSFSTFER